MDYYYSDSKLYIKKMERHPREVKHPNPVKKIHPVTRQQIQDAKMGLNGCGNFLKYSMFLFNAIILITGCGLLGLGIYTRTSQTGLSRVSSILGSYLYSTLSLVLIITGGVVIVLSFLGCCGALKEVKCMLVSFFALLLLMFLGLIVGGTVVYAFKDQIGEYTIKELYRSLNSSYGLDGQESVTEAWNSMQKIFQCCGVDGDINSTSSWAYYKENTEWFRNQTDNMKRFVPESCCVSQMDLNVTKCQARIEKHIIPAIGPPVFADMENDQLFTEGCYTAFYNFISRNAQIVGGIGVGIGVAMILGMIFAICLCKRIKDDYYFD
ncbi:tetraspanin-4 isoform X2 [Patella vulgata]|uniref:tetraspanin-4 isoform X2 n=1 Tax=Patella vulgata TaxID=6465 RepID=UPI00217FAAA1|nr:tetraspanin-4 isoform X2 [Patella vulgata]